MNAAQHPGVRVQKMDRDSRVWHYATVAHYVVIIIGERVG